MNLRISAHGSSTTAVICIFVGLEFSKARSESDLTYLCSGQPLYHFFSMSYYVLYISRRPFCTAVFFYLLLYLCFFSLLSFLTALFESLRMLFLSSYSSALQFQVIFTCVFTAYSTLLSSVVWLLANTELVYS